MKSLKSWFGRSPTPTPWRTVPTDDKDAYLDYIKTFQLNKDGVDHIRIMLYGHTGAGKSSFINSVESILRGDWTSQALSDGMVGTSFTTKYQTHAIKKESKTYPFVFMDLMGLEKERKCGICFEDVELAMQGHLRNGYTFNPKSPIASADPFYNSEPTLNDKTHVLVCVVSANTANLLSKEHTEKIREVRLAASSLNIPQIAILTKIDEACPEVQANIKDVYLSSIIKQRTEELHAAAGFQLNNIFPVKNYHHEFCLNDDMDILILMALKRMINWGRDFVENN